MHPREQPDYRVYPRPLVRSDCLGTALRLSPQVVEVLGSRLPMIVRELQTNLLLPASAWIEGRKVSTLTLRWEPADTALYYGFNLTRHQMLPAPTARVLNRGDGAAADSAALSSYDRCIRAALVRHLGIVTGAHLPRIQVYPDVPLSLVYAPLRSASRRKVKERLSFGSPLGQAELHELMLQLQQMPEIATCTDRAGRLEYVLDGTVGATVSDKLAPHIGLESGATLRDGHMGRMGQRVRYHVAAFVRTVPADNLGRRYYPVVTA